MGTPPVTDGAKVVLVLLQGIVGGVRVTLSSGGSLMIMVTDLLVHLQGLSMVIMMVSGPSAIPSAKAVTGTCIEVCPAGIVMVVEIGV